MKQIYRGRHLIHYGQVAIWDREDTSSYPVPVGPLPWKGPKGLCVPAMSDVEIELSIYDGTDLGAAPDDTPQRLTDAEISVGRDGLEAGNVTTASTIVIPWPAGPTQVIAYFAGSTPADATAVSFVLVPLA